MKKIIVFLFCAFFAFPVAAETSDTDNFGKVVVYYFHPDYRSFICNKVERMTKETVEQNFPAEVELGKLEFKSIDITKKENKPLAANYEIGIGNRVVVLARVFDYKDMEVVKPDMIWRNAIDEVRYKQYLSDEITRILQKDKPQKRLKSILKRN